MEITHMLIATALVISVEGVCYFPVHLQGIFSTQSALAGGSTHQYSQISILPDGIPVWGVCHFKSDGNVILHDETGGHNCFRCFHITQRSPNVVQFFTEGIDKCYTNEGAALATCPSIEDIKIQKAREIMLYKSRSFTRAGTIDDVFCPFSGQYDFTYNVNDGTENEVECPGSTSSISNCPNASKMEMKFRGCKFGDSQLSFQCLGSWTGLDNYKYMALWDTTKEPATKPQYRCAMYHVEQDTGRIFIGFSIDSTCTNHLISPWDGYETMVLTPKKLPPKPAPVHSHSCVFPKWSHGKWQDMEIADRSLWWRDSEKDRTYRTLCLSQHQPIGEKFAIYSQDQCGQEEFTCIWIKKRDTNVLEFKMATVQYSYFNRERVCSDDVFIGEKWRTQGRIINSERPGCPVLGQYSGIIPDATQLCAHMSSDCTNPQLMHYTVTTCENATDKYEGSRTKRNVFRVKNPLEMIRKRRHQSDPTRNHQIKHQHRRHSPTRTRGNPVYVFPSATTSVPVDSNKNNTEDLPFYYVVDEYGRKVTETTPRATVLADRQYQCLGQWEEDGMMYTFTYRQDVDTYECFAGVVENDKEAYIIEAGLDCMRGLKPRENGMKVHQEESCHGVWENAQIITSKPDIFQSQKVTLPSWWPSTSRKPWLKKSTTTTPKPRWKNQKPRDVNNIASSMSSSLFILIMSFIITR